MQNLCDQILIISRGKLVAFDRPENLEKRLLGSNEITVVTDAPPAEASALLAGWRSSPTARRRSGPTA